MKWKLSTPDLRLVAGCLSDAVGRGELGYTRLRDVALDLLRQELTRREEQRRRLDGRKQRAAAMFQTTMRSTGHKGV